MNSLFLWINIVTLGVPVALSFVPKLAFYRKWLRLFPSIVITGMVFLLWDQWFTEMNIWGFNALYLLGYYIGSVPVEEYILFFTITYTCVFIYECLRTYMRQSGRFEELYRWFTLLFFGISCTLLYWYNNKLYTAVTCLLLSLMLGTHLTVIRRRYMSWFYFAYIVAMIPLLVVNGVLGSINVIYYNRAETMGVQFLSIPIEDFLYYLAMLAMCIGLYEWFSRLSLRYRLRRQKQSA